MDSWVEERLWTHAHENTIWLRSSSGPLEGCQCSLFC